MCRSGLAMREQSKGCKDADEADQWEAGPRRKGGGMSLKSAGGTRIHAAVAPIDPSDPRLHMLRVFLAAEKGSVSRAGASPSIYYLPEYGPVDQ